MFAVLRTKSMKGCISPKSKRENIIMCTVPVIRDNEKKQSDSAKGDRSLQLLTYRQLRVPM